MLEIDDRQTDGQNDTIIAYNPFTLYMYVTCSQGLIMMQNSLPDQRIIWRK